MTPPPPRSTLFPYTTLFRSGRETGMNAAVVFDAYGTLFNVHSIARRAEELYPGNGMALSQLWRSKQLEYTWLDRKSTRLNSSHVEISYAVFCLKKKR